jgi:HPt (histidine-containing phosphotransfer) domain-containing protein
MVYDPGALDAALAAAVGDDPALVAELRAAFLASAEAHALALVRASARDDWQAAAWRLQSLAASFGAIQLMELAQAAARGAVGDPVVLRRIGRAIAAFED